MRVSAQNVAKTFGRQEVFAERTIRVESGERIAIIGGNGSGKTTMLRLLSGMLRPTQGEVLWHSKDGKPVERTDWAHFLNFTGPYVELIEELSMRELLQFHRKLRPFINELTEEDVLNISGLHEAQSKLIGHFSSGMKQRLRLSLALLTQAEVIFLDEPTSNLDQAAVDWMDALIDNHLGGRTLLIGTNSLPRELALCDRHWSVTA